MNKIKWEWAKNRQIKKPQNKMNSKIQNQMAKEDIYSEVTLIMRIMNLQREKKNFPVAAAVYVYVKMMSQLDIPAAVAAQSSVESWSLAASQFC